MLHLQFLGSPEVTYNETPISFPTRKALALFIYLAVENQSHPRPRLATIFYPENNRDRSLAALRSTLRYLRNGFSASGSNVDNFLAIDRHSLAFDPQESYILDLDYIQGAYEQASRNDMPDVNCLTSAINFIRGDFLGTFNLPDTTFFEDWIIINQEFWHRRVDQVFDRLSQVQLNQGAYPDAAETLERWLIHDPLSEIANYRKIHLFHIQGKRADALDAFDTYSKFLCEKIGLDPNPETLTLIQKIRS